MKGTEKQIRWAEDIKLAVVETMNGMIEMAKASNDPRVTEALREKTIAIWAGRIQVVESWESASDIIDAFAEFAKCSPAHRARNLNSAIKPRFSQPNALQAAIIAVR